MPIWAYVFITTRYPKRVLRGIRRVPGVINADALFGTPDLIAIVEGSDIPEMDAVIDRIALIKDVVGTDSKVVRVIDSVGPPASALRTPKHRYEANGNSGIRCSTT
jgi:DNA-binding Lrp family transcriptional regulator